MMHRPSPTRAQGPRRRLRARPRPHTQFRRLPAALVLAGAGLVALAACRSATPSPAEFERTARIHEAQRTDGSAFDPGQPLLRPEWYRGPGVHAGETGPWRFVRHLHRAFRPTVAMRTVQHLDQHYRAAGTPEYDELLDWLAAELGEGGFGAGDARFELYFLTSEEPVPVWQPVSARIELLEGEAPPRLLHAFDPADQRERVLLPVNAPSGSVRGPVALSLDEVREGSILVTQVRSSQVIARAEGAGAAAVLSASLDDYNLDPHGQERHLDSIQSRVVREGTSLPVAHISRRSYERIAAAAERGEAVIAFEAEVRQFEAPLRTLVAVVRGTERAGEAVVIAANLQGPGANDNASGVATALEGALSLKDQLQRGRLRPPLRSVAFVFGDEVRQSRAFLEDGRYHAVAAICARMTGQSQQHTGAIALLERTPDPGALVALPPDEHSTWGQGQVTQDDLAPNGLALIARTALIDVGRFEEGETGIGWPSADHPWEGGADHDVFLRAGIPGVLFWHFPDFTYRTNFDRPDMVDPHEMRRTGVAILATAMAVADPRPADLARYVESLRAEIDVRLSAAERAGERSTADLWRVWGAGARSWLRVLCLNLEEDEARALLRTESPEERARRLAAEREISIQEP